MLKLTHPLLMLFSTLTHIQYKLNHPSPTLGSLLPYVKHF